MELDSLVTEFFAPDFFTNRTLDQLKSFNWTLPIIELDNLTLGPLGSELQEILKILPADFRPEPEHWDDLSFLEKEHYLEHRFGKQHRFKKNIAVVMTAFYVSLFMIGVSGNFLTCLIIFMNSYMRTPPNYYLFNLAVTDIITQSIVMPIEIFLIWHQYPWPFGNIGCGFITLASELVTHVSIITMIAFTIERYTAICRPMQASIQSGKKKTLVTIVVIWIICLVPSFMWTRYINVKHLTYGKFNETIPESAMCIISREDVTPLMTYLTLANTSVLYAFPVVFLPFLYTRIALALRESEKLNNQSSNSANPSRSNRRTVVRMQIAVIACFLVCWTPYHVQRIIFLFTTLTESWSKRIASIQGTLHVVSGACYYLSSTINPFLYSLLSVRFRRGFQDVLRRCSGRMPVGIGLVQGAVSDGGQVQKSRSNGALRRGRPLEKFGPELNFNVVESETLRESRRKYKILYVSSLKSSDVSSTNANLYESLRSQYDLVRSCPPEIIIPSSAESSHGSSRHLAVQEKCRQKKQRKRLKRYSGEEFELNALAL